MNTSNDKNNNDDDDNNENKNSNTLDRRDMNFSNFLLLASAHVLLDSIAVIL